MNTSTDIAGRSGESILAKVRKSRSVRWSLRILYVFLFIGIFSDFLANEKPLFCKIDGTTHFPVLRSYAVSLGWSQWKEPFLRVDDWRTLDYEKVVFAPIPYSARTIDMRNSQFRSPFDDQRLPSSRFRHFLGTDELGRDVAAGLISGTRTALLVGLIAMSIAGLIGLFLGGLAGFFGDNKLRLPWLRLLLVTIGTLLGFFWAFVSRGWHLTSAADADRLLAEAGESLLIWIATITIFYALARGVERVGIKTRLVRVPVDLLVVRLIEVVQSIPALLLILSVAALIQKPNIFYVMVLIGLISWTSIARYVRAELLRIREMEYVQAAKVMGFSPRRILFKHALPNALGPVLITLAFGVAAAILTEAALSFLGIGVSPQDVTWGSMLSMARRNFTAWWLAVLPGLAIFAMVTVFNLIGQGLTDAMDRR